MGNTSSLCLIEIQPEFLNIRLEHLSQPAYELCKRGPPLSRARLRVTMVAIASSLADLRYSARLGSEHLLNHIHPIVLMLVSERVHDS